MRHADVVQAEREYVLPGSHVDLVFIWAQQKGWIVIHTIHRELSHWSSFCIWTHTQAKYYFKYAASVQNKKRTKKLVIRQSFRFHTYTLNLRVKFLQFIQNSSCIPHMECTFKTSKTWHTNQPFTTCQFAWPEGFPGRAQRSLTSVFTYKTLYMPFCSKYNHYICIFNLKWLMSMAVTLIQYSSQGLQMVLIALVNVYNQGLNSPVCLAKMSELNIWNSLVMGLSGTRNTMAVQVALKLS